MLRKSQKHTSKKQLRATAFLNPLNPHFPKIIPLRPIKNHKKFNIPLKPCHTAIEYNSMKHNLILKKKPSMCFVSRICILDTFICYIYQQHKKIIQRKNNVIHIFYVFEHQDFRIFFRNLCLLFFICALMLLCVMYVV